MSTIDRTEAGKYMGIKPKPRHSRSFRRKAKPKPPSEQPKTQKGRGLDYNHI